MPGDSPEIEAATLLEQFVVLLPVANAVDISLFVCVFDHASRVLLKASLCQGLCNKAVKMKRIFFFGVLPSKYSGGAAGLPMLGRDGIPPHPPSAASAVPRRKIYGNYLFFNTTK